MNTQLPAFEQLFTRLSLDKDEGLPSRYDYGIVLTAESFHFTED